MKRASLIVAAGVTAWVAAGCAPSIAPGYTIEKQRIEVTYSKATPDRVSVRAWYRMRNTGSQPIEEIRFQLPYNRWVEGLRVEPGGQPLVAQVVAGKGEEFTAHFGATWNQKERKEFVLTYDLKVVNSSLSLGDGRGPSFFLPSGGWYPYLLPPPGTLAQGGLPPDKWDLVVSVPQGYLVHASGTSKGQDRVGNRSTAGSSNRFEQKLEMDFDPFVVSGPFVEQQAHWGSETAFMWLAKASVEPTASQFGEWFAEEAAYFTAEFGLKDATKGQIWMIGCPGGLATGNDQPGRFLGGDLKKPWNSSVNCLTVPQGFIGPVSIDSPVVPDLFVAPSHANPPKGQPTWPSEDVQLAATWFPFAVHDAPDGPWFPMSGTPDYMALSFTVLKNPSKRGDYVRELIGRVDSDPERAKETLGSAKNIEIARVRSELFYLGLEDRCGAANVHHALARIVSILRGKTWDVGDLRSAMEAECGAELADFFRQWLNRPGIPDEFRTRYAGTPAAKPASKNN
ncbi:MAG: hypothetical protein WAM91_05340 [Candidatus Acidiferrales bacterium]